MLLGPSGCGKTTLLRLIAGLAAPDADGQILFDDEEVTLKPIERRKVGMVFQSYALFPNMNVAQNIGYGLRIRGDAPAQIDRRVGQMLELVQLDGLGARDIQELSGGQKQRVALARAVAIEPAVLLLDEPLAALDAKLRDALRIELKRLLTTLGVTSVFVTHDQSEAMALGDRIAVLSKGHIEQIGSAQDIYSRPATRFVAEFVGQVNRVRLAEFGEVWVRPEHIRVVRPQTPPAVGSSCAVSATVQVVSFLGNLTQMQCRLDDDQMVLVELSDTSLTRGQRLGLIFDASRFLRYST